MSSFDMLNAQCARLRNKDSNLSGEFEHDNKIAWLYHHG